MIIPLAIAWPASTDHFKIPMNSVSFRPSMVVEVSVLCNIHIHIHHLPINMFMVLFCTVCSGYIISLWGPVIFLPCSTSSLILWQLYLCPSASEQEWNLVIRSHKKGNIVQTVSIWTVIAARVALSIFTSVIQFTHLIMLHHFVYRLEIATGGLIFIGIPVYISEIQHLHLMTC